MSENPLLLQQKKSMQYKFQPEYNQLSEVCPPSAYVANEMGQVYRWVFDSIENPDNFRSQYHKNPKRFQLKSDYEKCQALALSMFNDLDGAKSRFLELAEVIGEKIYQTLGTKIASGYLTSTSGVNGPIERLGHFNHHPALESNYATHFIILQNEIL